MTEYMLVVVAVLLSTFVSPLMTGILEDYNWVLLIDLIR